LDQALEAGADELVASCPYCITNPPSQYRNPDLYGSEERGRAGRAVTVLIKDCVIVVPIRYFPIADPVIADFKPLLKLTGSIPAAECRSVRIATTG
jgi:hypothetical protein